MMWDENFKERLSELRGKKGVSARDMSLSIGQNAGYINNIENGKALPSMSAFFFICDYLGVTPKEFFEEDNHLPGELRELTGDLKLLSGDELKALCTLARSLAKDKQA